MPRRDLRWTFAPLGVLLLIGLWVALRSPDSPPAPDDAPSGPAAIATIDAAVAALAPQRPGHPDLYVLGIAITYSALCVFAALSGKLFGAWQQHPAVLGILALLLLVMAASRFGTTKLALLALLPTISIEGGRKPPLGSAYCHQRQVRAWPSGSPVPAASSCMRSPGRAEIRSGRWPPAPLTTGSGAWFARM